MIGKYSVMPTAVMMLSIEKTMSIMMIWMRPEMRPSGAGGLSSPASLFGSTRWWISVVAFQTRNNPPASNKRSRTEKPRPNTVASGARQMHHPGGRSEQREAEYEGQGQAENARQAATAFFDPVGEDGDEHQIVEAEHDLHGDQGRERRPRVGIFREAEKFVHAPPSPRSFELHPAARGADQS